jgi:predicted NBD/HSP70 family sugar kinase
MKSSLNKNNILPEFIRPLPLDDSFCPAAIWIKNSVEESDGFKKSMPVSIAITKDSENTLVYNTRIIEGQPALESDNLYYIEQTVKTLLWIYGGYKVYIGGHASAGEYINKLYSGSGKRAFDASIMSRIYEKPFEVQFGDYKNTPAAMEKTMKIGRHLDGCRIGFDLGASDRKVSAVIDGKPVFSEEVIWNPGQEADPKYHYTEIMAMLHQAAVCMPRVDAIGGSSAGIYINNRVMIASLFRSVPAPLFEEKVKNIFLDIQKEWNVPLTIINDGEVTALAGSMSLDKNEVLGISMGSSEAGGYVNSSGGFNPWINELAFVPVDFNPNAAQDEWSGDIGCGVQYFSQQAVARLAEKAGIEFEPGLSPARKLAKVQDLMKKNDNRAKKIFTTIGGYFGYALAYYSIFYKIQTVLILGRVTSGEGGIIILREAKKVLEEEFPSLYSNISINLPDEKNRRVGQSIAAASLPQIKK